MERNASSLGVIPSEHRLVSEGKHFAEVLFHRSGVDNVRKHVELIHYHLSQFVNATTDALTGITHELTALRLMTTQDRMV